MTFRPLMKCFDYSLPDYPTLVFSSSIQVVDRQIPAYEIHISAEGPLQARMDWRYSFEQWCRGHGRILTRKRPYQNTSTSSAVLKGTPAIVAYIVDWIGLEWLERTMEESTADQAPTDVSALFVQQQELLSLVHKIDARTRVADYRAWAAARAMLGLPLPTTELTSGNWDHLFEQDQKNTSRK
ncbi:hypothetical protein [Microvirga splendida]|uniref:Uncharacterized protein n=1 Tax=Microvirga splendida TaxID=2795727 RepID=A0ABS0Y679_9HYPH|nr:hypothetical protein [Microvirga splendida]MBJ6127801.1 hypothetical protein [Microvirga splendida]